MKTLFVILLVFSNFARAEIQCRVYANGVDQGEQVSITGSHCNINNGYHSADYKLTSAIRQESSEVYICQNTRTFSWYAPALYIKIDSDYAEMRELSEVGWGAPRELRCNQSALIR